MDRSWMSKDRMSREYEEGVEYFINFALEHCPNQRGIRCPCMRCGNLIHHTPNKIREHMFFNGIDQSYCTWYWHGEAGPTSSQPTEMAQRYDTMDCGDVASTVEMVHAIEDEFMTDPMSFKKLLEDAEKPLYPSCIKFTKLSALVKLYNVKARNELNEASSCPTCGTSRWKVNKAGARNTKRIPAKVLWYFPPIPRNLRLAISADGINPHSSMTRPRQPGKDIDVYLAPLVDDLKTLWEVGVKAYDAHQQEFFTLKAILLWTINDFPAYGNLSGCTVKGYYACPICGEETNSHWLKHGNKNSYTGHRRFLPCNHPFRKQKKAFNGKTKDGVKSRLDLLEMGLRPDLAPRFGLKRTYLPPACYTLSRKEKKIVLQTLADLKVPEGYCSNFRNLVSMEELKLNGLKSHDYHALMQQLLPVAIRSVLPKHVRYAITRLCFFFNALCAKVVDVSRLNDIQQDIVVHESPQGYVRNHNRPEGCIAECYIAEEALEFCTEYLSGMDAIGIPSSMKDEWKYKISSSIKESKVAEDEHVRTFSHWLRKKVSDDISKKEPIEKELKWLAQGPRQQVLTYPGYIIHGCRYHIKNRDEARVNQNSGVSIVASTMQIASSKCDWVDSKNGVKVDGAWFT
ncbi:hypothetical protein CK203_065181 [Vitis vinifera]|uniref:Transposase-associated domain-containing protein n=1 Tax=Vitis vinifera TaxID=29760 RepID=A0A438G2C4_VITVI|nr:hypothetical protein CK203_065181 [Vitis vinifera]